MSTRCGLNPRPLNLMDGLSLNFRASVDSKYPYGKASTLTAGGSQRRVLAPIRMAAWRSLNVAFNHHPGCDHASSRNVIPCAFAGITGRSFTDTVRTRASVMRAGWVLIDPCDAIVYKAAVVSFSLPFQGYF